MGFLNHPKSLALSTVSLTSTGWAQRGKFFRSEFVRSLRRFPFIVHGLSLSEPILENPLSVSWSSVDSWHTKSYGIQLFQLPEQDIHHFVVFCKIWMLAWFAIPWGARLVMLVGVRETKFSKCRSNPSQWKHHQQFVNKFLNIQKLNSFKVVLSARIWVLNMSTLTRWALWRSNEIGLLRWERQVLTRIKNPQFGSFLRAEKIIWDPFKFKVLSQS